MEEIAKIIGVDSLGYLSLQDVVKLADNTQCGFCTACFGGGYPYRRAPGRRQRPIRVQDQ